MASTETAQLRQELAQRIAELGSRIRRYTLDDQKSRFTHEQSEAILTSLEEAWTQWLAAHKRFYDLADNADESALRAVEQDYLSVNRKVDLVQRHLVSGASFSTGVRTIAWLAASLVVLILLYLLTHGVRGLDLTTFEPLGEWGPMKYVEVAFWSLFGVLCWLLFLAADYVARRDFDKWYQPWYLSTTLRAPFMTIILMMIVLEFTEWYGEDTWIETFLLEEGNKFYFIAFMSFCLGLMSDQAAGVTRDLADGVVQFARAATQKVSRKLSSGVMPSKPK